MYYLCLFLLFILGGYIKNKSIEIEELRQERQRDLELAIFELSKPKCSSDIPIDVQAKWLYSETERG